MKNTLKVWEKLAAKYDSDPRIEKVYLQSAVYEGKKVIEMLNNTEHPRLDVYWHFGRVAVLYNLAGLFSI